MERKDNIVAFPDLMDPGELFELARTFNIGMTISAADYKHGDPMAYLRVQSGTRKHQKQFRDAIQEIIKQIGESN